MEEENDGQKLADAGEMVAKLLDGFVNARMLNSHKSKLIDPIIVELYEKGLYKFLQIKDFGRFLRELATHYQYGDKFSGIDCAVDFEKAVYWYEKAAELGDSSAQYHLGDAYERGEMGLNIDLDKSAYWYQKVAELGDNDAAESLERIKKLKK